MLKDFVNQIQYIPRALILSFLFIIVFIFFKENKKTWKNKLNDFLKSRWLIAFLFYTAFILMSTFLGRQYMIPYTKILDHFKFASGKFSINEIVENIILYIPYTFVFLQAFHPLFPWKYSLKIAFLTSLSIELCQLVFWLGYFQLGDILFNTIGGAIGCGIWYLVKIGKEKR